MDPRTELQPVAAPPVRKQGLRRPAAATPAVPVEAHSADTTPTPAETASGTRTEKVLAATRATALWLRDSGLAVVGYLGVLVVCGYGWRTSFIGLHTFAVDHMGLSDSDAWGVPITFDGGAGVLTLVVARAAMNGRGAIVWRLGVLALTLLSSWINWVHIFDPDGRRIASLLPIVAVGAFEGLLSEARKAYERRTGNVRPRLSLLRWVFDFAGTLRILRAYVLGIPLPDQMVKAAAETAQQPETAVARQARKRRNKPETRKAKPTAAEPAVPGASDAGEPKHAKATQPVSIEHSFERPDWVADDMSPTKAMTRYLDEHGETPGAVLEKWATNLGLAQEFKTGLGRTTLLRWKTKRDRDQATAVGGE